MNLRIDVSKIDKSRIFEGKKGKYLDMTLFIDTEKESEYGDNGMIVQAVTKEERDQDIQGAILGNAKIFYNPDAEKAQSKPEQAAEAFGGVVRSDEPEEEQLPF